MIKYVRLDTMQSGKHREAREKAIKLAEHINTNCPPVKPIELLMPITGGGQSVITWMADFADLGAWEKWWANLVAHENTGEFMASWGDVFVAGAKDVQFYRFVEE